jgi:hypothetical protein
MENSKLNFKYFYPEVFQAVAGKNFVVYAYMNDGNIRMLDMKPIIKNGGVFAALKDEKIFREKLTVLNNSVAWDMGGNRDKYNCIDIDPFDLFNCPVVLDIPEDEPLPDEIEAIMEARTDTSPTVSRDAINWD